LGASIVAPKADDDVNESNRKALEKPNVFREFLNSINGRIIPPPDICKNTLMRKYHLSKEEADACYKVLMKNINDFKLFTSNAQGKKFLRLDKLSSTVVSEETQEKEAKEGSMEAETRQEHKEVTTEKETEPSSLKEEQRQVQKQIFVAHGKNKKPLEQLTKILTKYKLPHIVASDEPHRGRPIGVKVGEEMKKCTAGIFIFTADEESKDEDGKVIMKPNDNVVYELGAGSVLYTNKIIILREEGVNFATDFTELGRITFDKDKLDAKGLEIMSELAALEIIKFSVT
jgi:predicted nucleotide-binding protein